MNYTVINRGLSVGHIDVTAVASSSVFLVGDTESIVCSSIFDTPPESLIISRPFVPLSTS
ncbi:spore gernimation protein GerPD [Pseudalkalibacillus hwajinpoensis]|uniref:spore gernimation protein GerPD n=1 Tax=Guptibacillus hwajinpoensis TaxID=208199 RepID=UPI001CD254F3|nr:spore gernimation protein GerPD [Pseudalkalibacillus hwajinpoensis]